MTNYNCYCNTRSKANRYLVCAIDLGEDLQEDDSATNLEETCELGAEDAIARPIGAEQDS